MRFLAGRARNGGGNTNIDFKSDVGDYTYRTDGYHPHTVENAGGVNYQYDGNGNQTVRQGQGIIGVEQLIDYTSFDMPESVTFGANPNASRIELEYDAGQSRILKRTITPSGAERTNVYAGELYERRQGSSGFEHQYLVYAGGRPIAQVSRTGTTDTKRFLHDDRLGSVEMVTSGTGTVEHSQKFGVFGTVATGVQPGGATGVRRGFTGHEHDADLGLINMRGRVYDPVLGRFLTADPFASGGQGLNRYSYVGNNPTNFVDPSGFQGEVVDGVTYMDPLYVTPEWQASGEGGMWGTGPGVEGTPPTILSPRLDVTYAPAGSGQNDPASTDFAPSAENEQIPGGNAPPFGFGAPPARGAVSVLSQKEFVVPDTSEVWKWHFTIVMMLTPIGEGGGLIELGVMGAARLGGKAKSLLGAATGVSVAGRFPLSAINATSGTTNCVNCALALDATLGGSRASALGGPAVSLSQVPAVFGATGFTRFSNAGGIQSLLQGAGPGARGVVVGLRGPGAPAHAFNAVNQGGVVSFLDAQAGGAASLQGYQSFLFIRTF